MDALSSCWHHAGACREFKVFSVRKSNASNLTTFAMLRHRPEG
jgi:hypothetical protein